MRSKINFGCHVKYRRILPICSLLATAWIGIESFSYLTAAASSKDLPADLIGETLSHLSLREIAKKGQLNKQFREVILSDQFYHQVVMKHDIYEILRQRIFRKKALEEIQSPQGRQARLKELLDPNTEFVEVASGTFKMGTPSDNFVGDLYHKNLEHWVHLNSYKIQKKKVTQLLWYLAMMDEHAPGDRPIAAPSYFNQAEDCSGGDHLEISEEISLCIANPVESVSWETVEDKFIPKLRSLGFHLRLPTEAEWERAARGKDPKSRNFYSGFYFGNGGKDNSEFFENTWFFGNSDEHTHPVGLKHANSMGLYDILGNTSEWVSDWYQDPYDPAPDENHPLNNPKGPSTGTKKVSRGGGFIAREAAHYRSDYRSFFDPKKPYYVVGVRLVHE